MRRNTIYYIRNLVNHRIYVDVSRTVELRIQQHLSALRRGHHINRRMQSDWNEHGIDGFRWGVLEVLSTNTNRNQRERNWIDVYRARDARYGYNFDPQLRKGATS